MDKIKRFENQRFENLGEIYGGRETTSTGNGNDKVITYENGDVKVIDGCGFGNWISGNRTVTTYKFEGYRENNVTIYSKD
jgi:hypothetical protein